jgi:MFS transporter, DHA1 family, inner membrane transport protein
VAPGAQLMGAAVNQSATNAANSIGAALGSLAIAGGFGYLSPAWAGAGLAAIGFVLAAVSFRAETRIARGSEPAGEPAGPAPRARQQDRTF